MKLKGERVASDVIKELSNILLTEVKDEDLKRVTITYATVTNEKRDKVIKDMNNASGYFRSELAKRLNIRHIPELHFVYDTSIEYGQKIENIIKEINLES